MTIDEFLDKLEASGIRFRQTGGHIRTESGDCPICALAGNGNGDRFAADGVRLGLTHCSAYNIVYAADYEQDDNGGPCHSIRERLLKLCD